MSKRKASTLSAEENRKIQELEALWVWIISARARFQRQLDWLTEAAKGSKSESSRLSASMKLPVGGDWLRSHYEQSIVSVSAERELFDRDLLAYTSGTRNAPPFALQKKYRDARGDVLSQTLNLPLGVPVRKAGSARDVLLSSAYECVKRFIDDPADAMQQKTAAASLHVAQQSCAVSALAIPTIAEALRDALDDAQRPRATSEGALWLVAKLGGVSESTIKKAIASQRKAPRSQPRSQGGKS